MTDLDAWLSSGSRPRADVPICLVGDLAARYDAAMRELLKASADENRSLADDTITRLAAEVDALQAQMVDHTQNVTLEALPINGTDGRPSYMDLLLAHPPRDGDEVDARIGGNRATFLPALVRASVIAPEFTDEQWSTLLGKLTSRQWDELWVTARDLNREDVQAPKSLGFSGLMQTSGEKPKPRGRSGSRSSGSAAGSRKRRTSTTKKAAS